MDLIAIALPFAPYISVALFLLCAYAGSPLLAAIFLVAAVVLFGIGWM
jgi:hypothetical protein